MKPLLVRSITLIASLIAAVEIAFQTPLGSHAGITFGEAMIAAVTLIIPLAGFHITTWRSNRKLRKTIEKLLTGQFAYEHEILCHDMAKRENKPIEEIFITRARGMNQNLGRWSSGE